MRAFLTFALVAPMASFGSVAVGERRGGWDRPGRSAVLGLIGACLGLERGDEAGQAALADGYALALLCGAPGLLLADFHTAQVPPAKAKRHFATRAAELRAPDLNTILSRRDYRTGAWHLACVWPRLEAARWTLPDLDAAMRRPAFVPYLGRKACPLGLPLAPRIRPAADAAAALLERHADGPETALRERLLSGRAPGCLMTLDDDDVPVDDARRLRTEIRRDQPRSRGRWQFDLRREAVLDPDGPAMTAAAAPA